MADGYVFNFADDIAAVAIANPADFREIQAVILLFQFATLRKTKVLFQAFFLEFREAGTLRLMRVLVNPPVLFQTAPGGVFAVP
ncbi:hypothetical protein [Neisseria polysaccharea]|uniref:hypothetical protein n=1 Tax=Neisseria polysaccharea TaxID=489 RepID=UPI0027DF1499|nr:hypothetical protein [Neisseria polysaccharea]